ncbi:MAG: NDP-sugar synthase [Acidobacteriota bacterium]|nr:MAG: NDP-sugar synthase [Acidobacteriota bacterium]
MRAMILAAGRGERLRPLTDACAKPALPVLHESLIVRVLKFLRREGVEHAVINLHHCPRSIRDALSESRARAQSFPEVEFSEEETLLGTAGGLLKARAVFEKEELFLLANGDCIYDFSLREAVARARRSTAAATLVCAPHRAEHTAVWRDTEGRVLAFGGDAPAAQAHASTFAGVHILRPDVFLKIPADRPCGIVRDVYLPLLEKGARIEALDAEGFWEELGTPRRFLEASRRFAGHLGKTLPLMHETASADLSARLEGFVVLERGARADEECFLENTIVLDDARVGRGARLRDCLVAPGASVEDGAEFREKVLTSAGAAEL